MEADFGWRSKPRNLTLYGAGVLGALGLRTYVRQTSQANRGDNFNVQPHRSGGGV